jgi:lysine 2,3-aminomutase
MSFSHGFTVLEKNSPEEEPPQLLGHCPTILPSEKTLSFIKSHYPFISLSEWSDWRWQIANSISTLNDLSAFLELSDDEIRSFDDLKDLFPLRITPYYMSLIDRDNSGQGIRKSVVPVIQEEFRSVSEKEDPLNEDACSPIQGIVHRYPDRVLFLVTGFCSTYCRYCTRSRMVGSRDICSNDYIDEAIGYIEKNKTVRDVLISGGDPLTMSDEELDYILGRIRRIPHVEIIRIGTKVPVVLPHRINQNLIEILRKYHPLFMSIHFTHPDELTYETKQACEKLADAGIPLGSQTVLLKGINDEVVTMKNLMQGLLKIRVRPYYLYQCDPILGSSHFRTPVGKGLDIIKGIRGFTSGYAVPNFVIDAPGGGGKIPLLPDYFVGKEGNDIVLKNYDGKTFRYPDYF